MVSMKNWNILTFISRKVAPVFALCLVTLHSFAQSDSGIEMADKLREDGKIWVVVGVILLIFTGVTVYLVSLDRKISNLEKKLKSK